MENTSDSDTDFEEKEEETNVPVDPKQLTWGPWLWFYANLAGEKLAWFFGITKPRYYAEIQEFERMDEEEREAWRNAFQDVETKNDVLNAIVTTKPPESAQIYSISSKNKN